jgi:hypothetical protein
LGRPEPTIKFNNEAVTDKVYDGLGFIGENKEVMRSPSLNCNIASLIGERPLVNLRSLIKVT